MYSLRRIVLTLSENRTPLQLARQYGHDDAAAVLAKRGAVIGSKPSKWSTELQQVRLSEDGRGLQYIGEGLVSVFAAPNV
jgi:ankyrin repeat protein